MFNYFTSNKVLTNLQSGFIPGDLTVNQITYLYDFIVGASYSGKDLGAVFCNVCKAFDKD